MIIEKLTLTNFQKHKALEVEFENGLNLIVGPNWSGKTTILRGILYALWGSSGVNNVKATSLVNAESNKMRVNLLVRFGDELIEIERGKDSAFVKNEAGTLASGQKAVTEYVEKLAGKSTKDFLYFNYVEQEDARQLLKIGGAKIATLLAEVTGIDLIEKVIQKASSYYNENKWSIKRFKEVEGDYAHYEERYREGTERFEKLTRSMEGLLGRERDNREKHRYWSDQLSQLQEAYREAEEQRAEAARLEGRRETLREAVKRSQALAKPVDLNRMHGLYNQYQESYQRYEVFSEAEKRREILEHQLEKANAELAAVVVVDRVDDTRADLEAAKQQHEERLYGLRRALKEYEDGLRNAVCPTCKRAYDECASDHAEKEAEALRASLKETESAYNGFMGFYQQETLKFKQYQDSIVETQRIQTQLGELVAEISRLPVLEKITFSEVEELRVAYLSLYSAYQSENERFEEETRLIQEIEEIDIKLGAIPMTKAPTKASIDRAAKAIKELETDRAAYIDKLEDCQQRKASFESFFAEVGNVMARLETELSHAKSLASKVVVYNDLTKFLRKNKERYSEGIWQQLLSYTSQFVSEATNGDTTELTRTDEGEFQYRENGRLMPVEMASGMQGAILGVSLKLALGSALGSSSDILLLDEATAGGTDENSLLFTNLLRKYGKQVVLVTHRQADTVEADHVIDLL